MDLRDNPLSSRASRIVLALTAVIGLCAAVAAAPSPPSVKDMESSVAVPIKAAFGDIATSLKPLGRGPAIRVGRAYGAEDEDCILAVTQVTDATGRVHVTRGVACAN